MNSSSIICTKPDLLILVQDVGVVVLLAPITKAAKRWIQRTVANESQWFGPALIVEDKAVKDLLHGMAEAGLSFGGPPDDALIDDQAGDCRIH